MICVTNTNLPGIRRCTIQGQHRVTCPDHEGWREDLRPGTCRGCLPREAETGHLCRSCYERVVAAVAAWPAFREKLDAAEGRVMSAEGGGSSALGFANLSLVFLALDECERHRESLHGTTVDVWVQTPEGAADAIMFSHAAERAWNALPVEMVEDRKPTPQRCPACGWLPTWGNDTRKERGADVVTCRNCGFEVARIRPEVERWTGSATCEHQLHADCDNLACTCQCHNLGTRSRPAGAQALWDADQHTIETVKRIGAAGRTFRIPTGRKDDKGEWIWLTERTLGTLQPRQQDYRADWIISDALTIEPTKETRAA